MDAKTPAPIAEEDADDLPIIDPYRDADFATALADLSEKQRAYVECRLQGMTKLASGRAAGYAQPEVNAYRVERHPAVAAALRKAAEATAERVDLKREDIVRGMQDAIHSAATATELVAAWREIGKLVGAYEPAKVDLNVRLDQMTVAQLQRMPTEQLIELSKGDGYLVQGDEDPNDEAYAALRDAIAAPEPIKDTHADHD